MIYVISDIHGHLDLFLELLDRIRLTESDTLYVLGDVLDRGPNPIRTILKLMGMPNVVCLAGNHELMALECLEFLMTEITERSIEKMDEKMLQNLMTWQLNGSRTTIDEFRSLDFEVQQDVIDYMKEFIIYEELMVNGNEYLLVHGGLGNYAPDKDLEDYSLKELIWDRADYGIRYFDDIYVVTGHTPTQEIRYNPRPGYIYKGNNHIAVDCGCYRPDGQLAAVCLDTGEEYYVSNH
ncbi:MAG: serine/threonine protein phosphatase [Lachnospiraceae bacterium]|nr:serine/threonine protein phosphatase [Lachnospiraceae bacterium]